MIYGRQIHNVVHTCLKMQRKITLTITHVLHQDDYQPPYNRIHITYY